MQFVVFRKKQEAANGFDLRKIGQFTDYIARECVAGCAAAGDEDGDKS
jgi:hypothetical protein